MPVGASDAHCDGREVREKEQAQLRKRLRKGRRAAEAKRMEGSMIKYEVPDFTGALGLNLFFARLLRERPEAAMPNVAIESMYGSFPNCVLNGGRTYVRERTDANKVEWTFQVLDEYGIRPRLTFTNMLAGEDDFRDPYANMIMAAAARHHGQVIVYSDALAAYVRAEYGMPVILSTTREIADPDELNRQLERYDYVVLNYNLNKRSDVLSQVERPEKLEVMVNEFCMPGCPRRAEHYRFNARMQREGRLAEFPCAADKPDWFKHEPGHPTMFTDAEVAETNQRWGIECFKIVGRGTSFDTVLESLAYYLVKPAYREEVKQEVRASMRN